MPKVKRAYMAGREGGDLGYERQMASVCKEAWETLVRAA